MRGVWKAWLGLAVVLAVAAGWLAHVQKQGELARRHTLAEGRARMYVNELRARLTSVSGIVQRFADEAEGLTERFNQAGDGIWISSAALYRIHSGEGTDSERRYDLVHDVSPPNAGGFEPQKQMRMVPPREVQLSPFGENQLRVTAPALGDSSEHLLALQLTDVNRAGMAAAAARRAWLSFLPAALLVLAFCIFTFVLFALTPLKSLEESLTAGEGPEELNPAQYKGFAPLITAIHSYAEKFTQKLERMKALDPVTGLPGWDAAEAAYDDAFLSDSEKQVCFVRVNQARDFIKASDRRAKVMVSRTVAETLTTVFAEADAICAAQDHFFMVVIRNADYMDMLERASAVFRQKIQQYYLSNAAVSKLKRMNVSVAVVTTLAEKYSDYNATELYLHRNWETLVNSDAGGWAVCGRNGEWSRGDFSGGMSGEAKALEPDSLKDPAFLRKLFVIKLARMFKFNPEHATRLFDSGIRRPQDLLVCDAAALHRLGITPDELTELNRQIRVTPQDRLEYFESDFRDVFVTDVRMIRKISRDIIGKWFEAGYRRLADLADAKPEDLKRLGGAVSIEDLQAVIERARQPAAGR